MTAGADAVVTALAPSTARVLARDGQAGIQTAAIVRATAPAGVDGRQTASHDGHRSVRRGLGSTPSTGNAPPPTTSTAAPVHSPASEMLQAMTGSDSNGGLGTDAGAARGDRLRCAGIRNPATAPVNIPRGLARCDVGLSVVP